MTLKTMERTWRIYIFSLDWILWYFSLYCLLSLMFKLCVFFKERITHTHTHTHTHTLAQCISVDSPLMDVCQCQPLFLLLVAAPLFKVAWKRSFFSAKLSSHFPYLPVQGLKIQEIQLLLFLFEISLVK